MIEIVMIVPYTIIIHITSILMRYFNDANLHVLYLQMKNVSLTDKYIRIYSKKSL